MKPGPITTACQPPEARDDFSVVTAGSDGYVERTVFGDAAQAFDFYASEFARLSVLFITNEIEDFRITLFENGSSLRERGFSRKAIA